MSQARLLVASLNLCLDITLGVPTLPIGGIVRSTWATTTAGGKGVNVARAARTLGAAVTLVGFLPQADGSRFLDLYAGEGGAFVPVDVPGEMRLATVVLGEDGVTTVINGAGPRVEERHWAHLREAVAERLTNADVLVCSGSLPPGAPPDAYRELVALARAAGRVVAVDAHPAALLPSLSAQPDLVSPNLQEAEAVLGADFHEIVDDEREGLAERATTAARRLCELGARRAVVTAGASGAALASGAGTWWAGAPSLQVASPIGAGDCFVAAAATVLAAGASDVEVLRRGVAAASASTEQRAAGSLDLERALALERDVVVTDSW